MPKADRTPTTSRRATLTVLLAGTAAAVVAVPAAAASDDADAELIRLVAEFQRMEDRYCELDLRFGLDEPEPVAIETHSIVRQQHALAEEIAELRATTMEGLKAKASVLLAYSGYLINGDLCWSNHNELMGWSIARDLCGDEAAKPRESQAKWQLLIAAEQGTAT